MAEFRMIKTKIWRDKKFKSWDLPTKVLAMYFLTNENVPPAGLYEVDLDLVRVSVGFNGDTFENSLNKLIAEGWLMFDEQNHLIWIVNVLRHLSCVNASVMMNVINGLNDAPKSEIVDRFKERYAKLLSKYEGLDTGCGQAVDRASILYKMKSNRNKDRDSKTPSPTHSLFEYWDKGFQALTGEKYSFFGDRDGMLFKSVNKTYGLDKTKALIDEFFKQADTDPKCWWNDKLEVTVWQKQIPKLISHLTRGRK